MSAAGAAPSSAASTPLACGAVQAASTSAKHLTPMMWRSQSTSESKLVMSSGSLLLLTAFCTRAGMTGSSNAEPLAVADLDDNGWRELVLVVRPGNEADEVLALGPAAVVEV